MKKYQMLFLSAILLAACSSHKEYVKQDATYEDTNKQKLECEYQVELAKGDKDQRLIDKCMEMKGWTVKKN